jgi:hypothetical protein
MKKNASDKLSTRLRRAAITVVASGIVAATTAHANTSNSLVLVPPTDLPELARQSGDAMLLHETVDGRTLLYIEQNQGARLATLDVTDPIHIKGEGSVQLDASGPFDFVSPLGDQAEIVRFRQGHEDGVLDLGRFKVPSLKAVQGPASQGLINPLGDDGFTVAGQEPEMQAARDYQVVDAENSRELNRVFDVKQVLQEATKPDTGTTFMLTKDGLYVIRRPAIEWTHQMMMITPY